jgi:hypothetical protein
VDYRGDECYQEENAGNHRCIPENNRHGFLPACAVYPAVYKPIGIVPASRNCLIGENPQDSKKGNRRKARDAEAAQTQANANGKDNADYH